VASSCTRGSLVQALVRNINTFMCNAAFPDCPFG
jgi:hypothetical protein